MKQKLTNQDIAYLVTSLNELLDGSYLVQIYDGSEKDTRTLIFKLRKKLEDESNVYYLLFESGKRIHTIDEFVSIRKNPSGCVSKLRKELGKRRLFPIKQIGNDRIIDLQFSNDRHLILELYDKGNIILTDDNYEILFITRVYENSKFKLDVGLKYPIDILGEKDYELDRDLVKGYVIEKKDFCGKELIGSNVIEFDNLNLALKHYFRPIKVEEKKKKKKKVRNTREDNINNQIIKYDKLNEEKQEVINDIENNLPIYENIIKAIKFNVDLAEIRLIYNKEVKHIDKNNILIDNINFNINLSVNKNISNLYSEKKKNNQKKLRAIEVLNDTPKEVVKPKLDKLEINRKIFYFEKYYWFVHNDFVVLCGKNADDNEKILSNVQKDEILIHGNFPKSPWAIIKNPDKKEIPFKIINYAGMFLVQRSWNWTENVSDRSYYTYPDKISKSAPSGEFMGKGSRMVHEKNELANVILEMGIGLIFRSNNTFINKVNENTIIDFAMVMCAPYICFNGFDYKVKVKPSGKKNDKGRKKLIQSIINKFLKLKNNKVNDYIKLIPYEEWDATCIRTFVLAS